MRCFTIIALLHVLLHYNCAPSRIHHLLEHKGEPYFTIA